MANYGNILDAIRSGEDIEGVDLTSLLAGATKNPPQESGSSTAILPASAGRNANSPTSFMELSKFPTQEQASFPSDLLSPTSRTLNSGESNKGKGPSQNMDDANAFIRANRAKGGDQIASLLQGSGKSNVPGVRAEVGPDGQIVLTNIGADSTTTGPVPNQPVSPSGVGPGTGIIAPNTPLSVQSLYNTLLKAEDIDTARGTLASLRNAAAIETSKYESQAVQFAENQLGIPKLQAELQAAMAADLADPKYTPGMGDSRFTASIRTALEDARTRALTNSKVYLNNNADYATLKSTLTNADAEVARLIKVGDRKAAVEDQTAAELKRLQNQKNFQAQDLANAFDADTQQRISMLNPELKDMTADDKMIQMGKIFQSRSKVDKAWTTAITAPAEALPAIALAGNAYANRLVVAKEMANTGEAEPVIQARLDVMRQHVQNPKFNDAVKHYFGETKEGKKNYVAYQEKLVEKGLGANGKAEQAAMKYDVALQIERLKTTDNFVNNASNWKVTPQTMAAADQKFLGASALFTDAVTQTRKVVGRTHMIDVFNQFLGDSQGSERIAKGKAFSEIMVAAGLSKQDSIFGVPNTRALQSQLNSELSKSFFSRWEDAQRRKPMSKPEDSSDIATKLLENPTYTSTLGTGYDQSFAGDDVPVDLSPTR